MWQTIRKQTRPSTDIEFFGPSVSAGLDPSFKSYWQSTFVDSGKLIYAHQEVSEDQLELIITMIWDSKESVDEMLADPTVLADFFPIKNGYLEQHGMTEFLVTSEEI